MKSVVGSLVLLTLFTASCSDDRPVRPNSYSQIKPLDPSQSTGAMENQNQQGRFDSEVNENAQSGRQNTTDQEQTTSQSPASEQQEANQTLALQSELNAAQLKLQALEKAFQEKSAQVETIAEINQEFCAVYISQAKSCIALRKLISGTEPDDTKCVENGTAQNPFLSAGITAELRLANAAAGAQFELVANDVFVSSPITNATTTSTAGPASASAPTKVSTLTWKIESGASKTAAPALFEIKKLALRARGGYALPNFSSAEKFFVLKVGTRAVLDSDDLIPWASGEFKAVVNTIPFLGLLNAPECSITENDLSEISRTVRSQTEQKKTGGSL